MPGSSAHNPLTIDGCGTAGSFLNDERFEWNFRVFWAIVCENGRVTVIDW
jgi:hypothetical protein